MSARHPVVHINLLERRRFTLSVASMLLLALLVTLAGLYVYGKSVTSPATEARQRSERLAGEIRDLQARMAAITGEQTRNAKAVALRQEVEQLQPEAQAARALAEAVRAVEGGRGDDVGRALAAVTSAVEPGLWLTVVTVDKAGKNLDITGMANGGARVLRYASRANEALGGQNLRLDSLEMTPADGAAAPSNPPGNPTGPAARGMASGTVSFKLR